MADGIRIRPADNRPVPDNAMIVLRDLSRPIPPPKDGTPQSVAKAACSICSPPDVIDQINRRMLPHSAGIQHFEKTYHFQLEAGHVIVSTEIWDRLQAMPDNGGFVYVNHVAEPPTQNSVLGVGVETVHKVTQTIHEHLIPTNGGPT